MKYFNFSSLELVNKLLYPFDMKWKDSTPFWVLIMTIIIWIILASQQKNLMKMHSWSTPVKNLSS
jgi:hypothetical protein